MNLVMPDFEVRSRARRRALQALYQWQINPRDIGEIIAEFFEEQDFSNVDRDLFENICRGVTGQQAVFNEGLQPYLDRPMAQLDVMERVILQMGMFELQQRPETPARVIIDECVNLAHRFGAEMGHAFINGVLDKAARAVRPNEPFSGNSH